MNRNSMWAVIVGGVVAVLVVGAFVLGQVWESENESFAERLGETVDKTKEEVQQGIDKMQRSIEESGGSGDTGQTN